MCNPTPVANTPRPDPDREPHRPGPVCLLVTKRSSLHTPTPSAALACRLMPEPPQAKESCAQVHHHGRGVGVGAVFQLSTASCCNKHIDLTGWYMGDGPNKVNPYNRNKRPQLCAPSSRNCQTVSPR